MSAVENVGAASSAGQSPMLQGFLPALFENIAGKIAEDSDGGAEITKGEYSEIAQMTLGLLAMADGKITDDEKDAINALAEDKPEPRGAEELSPVIKALDKLGAFDALNAEERKALGLDQEAGVTESAAETAGSGISASAAAAPPAKSVASDASSSTNEGAAAEQDVIQQSIMQMIMALLDELGLLDNLNDEARAKLGLPPAGDGLGAPQGGAAQAAAAPQGAATQEPITATAETATTTNPATETQGQTSAQPASMAGRELEAAAFQAAIKDGMLDDTEQAKLNAMLAVSVTA